MRSLASVLTCAILIAGIATHTHGEAPDDGPLVGVVKTVVGTVETRPAVGQPWVPVKAGMTLAQGADIRTGFRARCILDMTDSLAQVDPLTLVRIAELKRKGNTVRTRLYMKQGNTQAVVEKKNLKSDFAIITPSATLSVRGTRGIQCGYFPAFGGQYGLADSGLIAVADAVTGRETGVRPGERTDDRATTPGEMLARKDVPIVMDRAGFEQNEKRAATRRRSITPVGVGAGGAAGPAECSATRRANAQLVIKMILCDVSPSGG